MTLTPRVLAGEKLAIARLLSQVENGQPSGLADLNELFPYTGAPGTGKSSLVNQLALYYRQSSTGRIVRKVAIVAIDPSSPFTGGAILGDRVRMRDLAGDSGVFIRSMAARGSLGGLAPATASAVQIFDAAGFDVIMIETVGAGQAEVDIARLAHTTIVVEAPGLGDEIQAIKAGILEIADILVVNKADRPGVENSERALRAMLHLAPPFHHGVLNGDQATMAPAPAERSWQPPILRTVATEGVGIAELADQIENHIRYLTITGEWQGRDRARLQTELESLLQDRLISRWRETISDSQYKAVLNQLVERKISPQQAVQALLDGKEA
jgi:GTPase